MKLSVIIPVYRVEATLDRCLQSVVGQTFTDLEVILVDDGSPDGCPQKCDEWGRQDGRIRVVHKQNGGLSDARNTGIALARGEYLTFVDSDDFLDVDTYAKVLPLADGSDIVEFPVFKGYGSSAQCLLDFGESTYEKMEDYWLRGQAYEHTYAWNKIYRRELFQGICFPKGRVFEDVWTLPLLLQRAKRVVTTRQGLYYYCLNPQGITATASGPQLEMLLEAHLRTMGHWTDDRYYMHVLNIQMDVCELTGKAARLPGRRVDVLGKGLPHRQRLKAVALRLLGIDRLCKLNKTIHQWRKRLS